jgi:hypothetical protein
VDNFFFFLVWWGHKALYQYSDVSYDLDLGDDLGKSKWQQIWTFATITMSYHSEDIQELHNFWNLLAFFLLWAVSL